MAHWVTCVYCNERFDRAKEEKDKEALEQYIMKMFNEEFVNPRVRKQINEFKDKYNYTYSGILKALVYFFEVKGNSIEKAKGGIGIVPYVYNDAYNYYYNIWLANQKNEEILKPEQMIIEVREVHIPVPQRKVKKRKLFTFLDEEEVEE